MTRRDPAVVSRTMSRIRGRDTLPELTLRRELWSMGLRYRVDYRGAPGRPDVCFPRSKVAVFVDGEFWHGRNWPELRRALSRGGNGKFWVAKIKRNRQRDRAVTRELRNHGWKVIRIWGDEVLRTPTYWAMKVFLAVKGKRYG